MWSAARLRASPGPQWGWRHTETPAREAPHIQADSPTASADLPPYIPMRRYAAILAALALVAVLVVGLPAGGRRQHAQAQVRPRPGRAQADRRPGPAGLAAPAVLAAAARRPEGVPRAAREPQGLPRGGQQVGVVVRPVPQRVPDLPAAGGEAGQAGRVHRRQRGRLDRSRPSLPEVRAAALPVLPRPRRGHREDDPGARELPDHRVLRPPREARLRPPGRRTATQSDLADDMRRYLS